MKLPWVSREMYEHTVDQYEREVLVARAEYAALLTKYHELAQPAPPVVAVAPVAPVVTPAEPSEISKVIREQASESGRYDHALASHLRSYAKQLKMQGKSDDEIVGELVKWQNTETMFPEST